MDLNLDQEFKLDEMFRNKDLLDQYNMRHPNMQDPRFKQIERYRCGSFWEDYFPGYLTGDKNKVQLPEKNEDMYVQINRILCLLNIQYRMLYQFLEQPLNAVNITSLYIFFYNNMC